jgi:hypothetical protein
VLIPFLWIDLILGMSVAATIVLPTEFTDSTMQAFVSVFLPAALIMGAVFGMGVWVVTLAVSVVFATVWSRVPRVPAVCLALAIPGAIAVSLYRPWETPTVGAVSGTTAVVTAILVAAVAGVIVVAKAETADVQHPSVVGTE